MLLVLLLKTINNHILNKKSKKVLTKLTERDIIYSVPNAGVIQW